MAKLLEMSAIDLPSAVEELDYSTLRQLWIEDYATRRGVLVASLDPNDPALLALEVGAYRETLIRARINDAVRQTMLASAFGDGLDDLGADPLYGGLERLVVDPGDPEAVPPVEPTMESDEDYKARLQLAGAALSVAGPAGAYESIARAAHGESVDISVTSPNPCEILVEVLHADDADPDILTTIEDALNPASVRPLGDRVTVASADKEESSIDLTVWVSDGPDLDAVEEEAQKRVDKLILPLAARVRSGELLSTGGGNLWRGAAMVAGVIDVEQTASTGMTETTDAWWPLTINITAVRV